VDDERKTGAKEGLVLRSEDKLSTRLASLLREMSRKTNKTKKEDESSRLIFKAGAKGGKRSREERKRIGGRKRSGRESSQRGIPILRYLLVSPLQILKKKERNNEKKKERRERGAAEPGALEGHLLI